jgi:hypothetical protein
MQFFEWRSYSANTSILENQRMITLDEKNSFIQKYFQVLTSEGYRCPFIGFIASGKCFVLRKVDAPFINKKTGIKEKRMKQVVVGKLRENESFGEISCVMKEPMTCSIVTETPCRIGIVPCEKIPSKFMNLIFDANSKLFDVFKSKELDNITLRLLLQTSVRTFADLTQNDLYSKYIEQEKKKEWKRFKNFTVQNVIDKYGIIYGQGKFKNKEDERAVESNEEF